MKTSFSLIVLAAMAALASLSAQTRTDYQAVVSSQNPTAYFKLDGSLESAVNSSVVLESFAGGYVADVFRNDASAWAFNDQQTAYLRNTADRLINGGGVSNTTSTAKGSISFLFRALSGPNIGGQRTLFDATTVNVGTSNHNACSLFFENDTSSVNPNSLKLRFGDSSTAILQASDVFYGSWYYFALTYDEARVPNKAIWYLAPVGGTFSTGMTTNSAESVAGDGTGLLIGQRADLTGAYRSPGPGRVDEFAIWARELTFLEISNQFARLPAPPAPGSTYEQVVSSQHVKYYFHLDNSLVESVGNTLMLTASGPGGAFTSDFLGNPSSAYSFSETNDYLYITNDLFNGGGVGADTAATGVGTISLQFRMLSGTNNTGQRFIFSAPGAESGADNNSLALFLESDTGVNPNSLKIRAGGTTFGNSGSSTPVNNMPVAYATELVPNAWYYFAMVYDETGGGVLSAYLGQAGGTLRKRYYDLNNDNVVGDNGWLVLGNMIQTNTIFNRAFRGPGDGVIDEFAIWHEEIGEAAIAAQFAAMTPATPPTLYISAQGGNVVLSWPASTPASFVLETTNVLDVTTIGANSWPTAGTATVVGSNFVVTNTVSQGTSFYRLHKL